MYRGCPAESPNARRSVANCNINAVVEVDYRIVWPEFSLDFLTRYDLAGTQNQHFEDLERLFPEQ